MSTSAPTALAASRSALPPRSPHVTAPSASRIALDDAMLSALDLSPPSVPAAKEVKREDGVAAAPWAARASPATRVTSALYESEPSGFSWAAESSTPLPSSDSRSPVLETSAPVVDADREVAGRAASTTYDRRAPPSGGFDHRDGGRGGDAQRGPGGGWSDRDRDGGRGGGGGGSFLRGPGGGSSDRRAAAFGDRHGGQDERHGGHGHGGYGHDDRFGHGDYTRGGGGSFRSGYDDRRMGSGPRGGGEHASSFHAGPASNLRGSGGWGRSGAASTAPRASLDAEPRHGASGFAGDSTSWRGAGAEARPMPATAAHTSPAEAAVPVRIVSRAATVADGAQAASAVPQSAPAATRPAGTAAAPVSTPAPVPAPAPTPAPAPAPAAAAPQLRFSAVPPSQRSDKFLDAQLDLNASVSVKPGGAASGAPASSAHTSPAAASPAKVVPATSGGLVAHPASGAQVPSNVKAPVHAAGTSPSLVGGAPSGASAPALGADAVGAPAAGKPVVNAWEQRRLMTQAAQAAKLAAEKAARQGGLSSGDDSGSYDRSRGRSSSDHHVARTAADLTRLGEENAARMAEARRRAAGAYAGASHAPHAGAHEHAVHMPSSQSARDFDAEAERTANTKKVRAEEKALRGPRTCGVIYSSLDDIGSYRRSVFAAGAGAGAGADAASEALDGAAVAAACDADGATASATETAGTGAAAVVSGATQADASHAPAAASTVTALVPPPEEAAALAPAADSAVTDEAAVSASVVQAAEPLLPTSALSVGVVPAAAVAAAVAPMSVVAPGVGGILVPTSPSSVGIVAPVMDGASNMTLLMPQPAVAPAQAVQQPLIQMPMYMSSVPLEQGYAMMYGMPSYPWPLPPSSAYLSGGITMDPSGGGMYAPAGSMMSMGLSPMMSAAPSSPGAAPAGSKALTPGMLHEGGMHMRPAAGMGGMDMHMYMPSGGMRMPPVPSQSGGGGMYAQQQQHHHQQQQQHAGGAPGPARGSVSSMERRAGASGMGHASAAGSGRRGAGSEGVSTAAGGLGSMGTGQSTAPASNLNASAPLWQPPSVSASSMMPAHHAYSLQPVHASDVWAGSSPWAASGLGMIGFPAAPGSRMPAAAPYSYHAPVAPQSAWYPSSQHVTHHASPAHAHPPGSAHMMPPQHAHSMMHAHSSGGPAAPSFLKPAAAVEKTAAVGSVTSGAAGGGSAAGATSTTTSSSAASGAQASSRSGSMSGGTSSGAYSSGYPVSGGGMHVMEGSEDDGALDHFATAAALDAMGDADGSDDAAHASGTSMHAHPTGRARGSFEGAGYAAPQTYGSGGSGRATNVGPPGPGGMRGSPSAVRGGAPYAPRQQSQQPAYGMPSAVPPHHMMPAGGGGGMPSMPPGGASLRGSPRSGAPATRGSAGGMRTR